MNDQQLKIRIKLNQIPQPLEPENLEETTDQTTPLFEKPPFDWQKISVAVLLLVIIFSGIIYWWVAEESSASITKSLPTENTHFKMNDSLIFDEETRSDDIVVKNESMASDITTHTVDVLPATKPIISAVKPIPKPVIQATPPPYGIIPFKKPEAAK